MRWFCSRRKSRLAAHAAKSDQGRKVIMAAVTTTTCVAAHTLYLGLPSNFRVEG